MTRAVRLALLALVACLPPGCKPVVYRWLFGYRIHRTVRIGISIIDARSCVIESGTTLGHGNVVVGVDDLIIGDHVRIGHLNLFRGGNEIRIGRYAEILRRNEINSIPDADVANEADPRLSIGAGAVITDGHRIDFTDRIDIGHRAILGGRGSSLWTHNRQRTAPIRIGDLAYVGSEIRMTPGSAIPPRSIVGVGSVIVHELTEEETLIGGVPAKVIKPLGADDLALVEKKTRLDLPDDV
jgi:acetyltransferase-like isoleucine patch superfamily enzyme